MFEKPIPTVLTGEVRFHFLIDQIIRGGWPGDLWTESNLAHRQQTGDSRIDDKDLGVETVAEYLNLFERLFLLDNQKPFSTNIRSSVRVKQSEKRQFPVPSLACTRLVAIGAMLLSDFETPGNIVSIHVSHLRNPFLTTLQDLFPACGQNTNRESNLQAGGKLSYVLSRRNSSKILRYLSSNMLCFLQTIVKLLYTSKSLRGICRKVPFSSSCPTAAL